MNVIPITNSQADRDIARCQMIGNVTQALDIAAVTLENAVRLIEGLMEAGGIGALAPETVRGINVVIAEARRIAATARETIA